jgi:hypothetical protein
MPDQLFQTLFAETEHLSWASTDEVHEHARRRDRRARLVVVTAAAVVVIAIAGGVAVARTDRALPPRPSTTSSVAPSPTGTPTPTPPPTPPAPPPPPPPAVSEPTELVNPLFLQPSDVGPGYRPRANPIQSGDWTLEYIASSMDCSSPGSARSRIARREWFLARGSGPTQDLLTQQVARYRAGGAARYLNRVRAMVRSCEPFNRQSLTVAAERFAGQDALLIRADFGGGATTKIVLVRQGDLVIEFVPRPERGTAATRHLGRKAAERLCGGTPVC